MKNIRTIEQQLIEKAMRDQSFRKKLFKNPELTIEEEFNIKLPESFKIGVLQENVNSMYLILPPMPAFNNQDDPAEAEPASTIGIGDRDSLNECKRTN